MDIHKNYIAEQMERVIKTPYHMMPTIFGQAVENICDYLTRKMIDKDAKESVEESYRSIVDEMTRACHEVIAVYRSQE